MHLSLLLYVYCALCSIADARPEPVTIPLTRRAASGGNHFGKALDATFTRYKTPGSLPKAYKAGKGKSRRQTSPGGANPSKPVSGPDGQPTTADIVLGHVDDTLYGEVSVGWDAPGVEAQNFTLRFDTGSSTVLLPGKDCSGCNGDTRYTDKGTFQHSMSKMSFGDARAVQIEGREYSDTVTIGGLKSYYSILTVMTEGRDAFSGIATGLFGLAFPALATNTGDCYVQSLIKISAISPEFAIFLGRTESGTESSFTLGTNRPEHYEGELTTLPVTEKKWWEIAIDGVNVAGDAVRGPAAGQAIVDTGTPFILAPKAIAAKLYKQMNIGAAPDTTESGGDLVSYSYRCNAKIDVSLVLGGKPHAINPLDFNAGMLEKQGNKPRRCVGAIVGVDIDEPGENWVLGTPFLKNWYSIYNYGESPSAQATVSFGKAKGNQ